MKFVTEIFRVLILKGVLWTWNFIRRHPMLTLFVVLGIPLIYYAARTYAAFSKVRDFVNGILDWFDSNGAHIDATYAETILRKLAYWFVVLIVPGGILLIVARTARWFEDENNIHVTVQQTQ